MSRIVDPTQKLTISLLASDAFVLYECLSRYQESELQILQPNASEYHALMHVLGGVEKWVEDESGVTPERYPAAVVEAYEDLSGPGGYRGTEPFGPPSAE